MACRVFGHEPPKTQHLDYIAKTKLWKYEPNIKTTEQLWENFKQILERHNQNSLDHPLSTIEFNQVKRIISNIQTPYQAGQFLYGLNGASQIEIDLDDGRHVFLTVFDQKHIGAGDTIYQVVNQIKRPAKITGKQNRSVAQRGGRVAGVARLEAERATGDSVITTKNAVDFGKLIEDATVAEAGNAL